MNKKHGLILFLISFATVCISAVTLFKVEKLNEELKSFDTQYVLYLGTNGKASNLPVFSPEEAKIKADEILFKYFSGFTIQEAKGGWLNDDGSYSHEYTLVIYLSDTTKEKIYSAMDELLKVFDQSSILLQSNQTKTEFYSGK